MTAHMVSQRRAFACRRFRVALRFPGQQDCRRRWISGRPFDIKTRRTCRANAKAAGTVRSSGVGPVETVGGCFKAVPSQARPVYSWDLTRVVIPGMRRRASDTQVCAKDVTRRLSCVRRCVPLPPNFSDEAAAGAKQFTCGCQTITRSRFLRSSCKVAFESKTLSNIVSLTRDSRAVNQLRNCSRRVFLLF